MNISWTTTNTLGREAAHSVIWGQRPCQHVFGPRVFGGDRTRQATAPGKKGLLDGGPGPYDFMMKLFGTTLKVDEAERKFHGRFMKTLRAAVQVFKLLDAVKEDRGTLRLTRRGQYLWVIMMREFFTGVNNFRDTCREMIYSPKTTEQGDSCGSVRQAGIASQARNAPHDRLL